MELCVMICGMKKRQAFSAGNLDSLNMVSVPWRFILILSSHLFTGALAISADIFNEGDSPKLLTSMNCLGNESHISQCGKSLFKGISCPTSGVVCQDPATSGDDSCNNTQVRLSQYVDTSSTREGRVELCLNRAWGTVCNTLFDQLDAQVACSQLTGFSGQGKYYPCHSCIRHTVVMM